MLVGCWCCRSTCCCCVVHGSLYVDRTGQWLLVVGAVVLFVVGLMYVNGSLYVGRTGQWLLVVGAVVLLVGTRVA